MTSSTNVPAALGRQGTGDPGDAGVIRVAVVGGGQNCEHEISLATAASVLAALDPGRYDVVALTIGPDGHWYDAHGRLLGDTPAAGLSAALDIVSTCDVVFPAVHGPRGEDGTLAGLCELAGVPYVGAGVRGGALAMDKWATKLIAEACGIRVAAAELVTAATAGRLRYEQPVVVKPVASGSSHGVTLVNGPQQLEPALKAALALDDRVLVEEVVTGREIDIAVLERPDGSRFTGPPLEITVPDGSLFDTTLKYGGRAEFLIPAALDHEQLTEMERGALTLFDALGCAGVTRFDFFVTAEGLVLNEVNTMPGMTEQSQVPKMFAAAGLPYPRLLDELIRGGLALAGRR
jgi:D-alanine-D-alanine ligase